MALDLQVTNTQLARHQKISVSRASVKKCERSNNNKYGIKVESKGNKNNIYSADVVEKGQKAFQGISFPIYLNDSIYFLSDFNDVEELSLPLISLSAGISQSRKR